MAQTDATAELKALMTRYMEQFSAGEFEAAVASYSMPFSWVIGPSIATAFKPEEFVQKMNAMRDPLVEQGFKRSELVSCSVRTLGANAALVGVEVARHFEDGRREVTGGTYIAHNDGSTWRLMSIIGHPLDEIVEPKGS